MASIIDQAIQLEIRAEFNYREASQATSDTSARDILIILAEEEARHADVLRGLKTLENVNDGELLAKSQSWIAAAVEGGAPFISSDEGLPAVLRRAMDLEQQTESFYREQASSAEDVKTRDLFTVLADIEKAHYVLVGSWVEYFNRPAEWIENAEFGVRDEY